MEDLGNWTSSSQVTGATLPQAHAALTAVADVHAGFWSATGLDATPWLPRLDSPLYLTLGQLYRAGWPTFVEKYGDLLPPASLDIGRRIGDSYEDLLRACTAEAPLTLSHGDFRLDNLFFDGATAALVDWQLVHQGPAVEDVSMFLTQSVDVETRRLHERDLVGAWYDRLAAAAPSAAAAYPLGLAWDHYRRMSLYTTLIPVVVGGSMDVGNERGQALTVEMAVRSFTAVADLEAERFLP